MKYQDSEGVEIAKQQMIAEKDVDAMSEIFDMFGDSTRKIGKMVYYSMADEHIENIYRMALEHIHEK